LVTVKYINYYKVFFGVWKTGSQPSGNRAITCRWDKMVKTGVGFANALKE